MAYNLQTLITILEQILDPTQKRWFLGRKRPEFQSVLEKAASLQQQILEKPSLTKIESLESQIREAAHKAEDIIESYMVDRMHLIPRGVRFTFSRLYLQPVMQLLDSATEQVKLSIGSSSTVTSFSHQLESRKVEGKKNNLVGVDADLLQLMDRLTNTETKLEIIPIVGMGGIGKSALALNLYEDSHILSHFDYRGWAAISQVYNMRSILLSLLREPNGKVSSELIGLGDSELKDKLHKRLFGRRYFIVLDDVWSNSLWDGINRYFPDNDNGSRIVITTRELDVAKYVNRSMQHHMHLLSKGKSADLLCQIAFGEADYPHELQEIGTKIASDCRGLPLAINVIGGLLSKVERSRDIWEHISRDVKAALVGSDGQFSDMLSLSYNHLPIHLKPCFLYIGGFPEDYKIKASRLVHLWIAEGFVKSNGDKSLEEEAEDYLKALVDRNLLLVTRNKYNGKPMRYSIHDLLRELCIKKANEERFLRVKNSPDVRFSNDRRVCVHSEIEDVCASPLLMSLARSFICTEKHECLPFLPKLRLLLPVLRLLRVLDVLEMAFEEFPREIYELVNLLSSPLHCTLYT